MSKDLASQVVPRKLSEITADPERLAAVPERTVDALTKIIQEQGFRAPFIVSPQNELRAGHGRFLAAQRLKLHTVPVVVCATALEEVDAKRQAAALVEAQVPKVLGLDRKPYTPPAPEKKRRPPRPPKVDKGSLEVLDELREMVLSGELHGIAAVGLIKAGGFSTRFAMPFDPRGPQAAAVPFIAGVELLKDDLMNVVVFGLDALDDAADETGEPA